MKIWGFKIVSLLAVVVLISCSGDSPLSPGEMFLEDNKMMAGVIVTASGLQYEVLQQGTGPMPDLSDRVRVHYRGMFIDGQEFDSSFSRGAPLVFSVTGVIEGWTEALLLMNVGSEFRLVIPSELAYGERGQGSIGPNEVLVFTVELLEIL